MSISCLVLVLVNNTMIRWYDYVIALVFADAMITLFFGLPVIGAIASYGIYYAWKDIYCSWRRDIEYGQ